MESNKSLDQLKEMTEYKSWLNYGKELHETTEEYGLIQARIRELCGSRERFLKEYTNLEKHTCITGIVFKSCVSTAIIFLLLCGRTLRLTIDKNDMHKNALFIQEVGHHYKIFIYNGLFEIIATLVHFHTTESKLYIRDNCDEDIKKSLLHFFLFYKVYEMNLLKNINAEFIICGNCTVTITTRITPEA
jgi:hypothetical protein